MTIYDTRFQARVRNSKFSIQLSLHRCFEARFVDEVNTREETEETPTEGRITDNPAVHQMYEELKTLAWNAVNVFVTK